MLDGARAPLDRTFTEAASDHPRLSDWTGSDRPIDWAFDRSALDKKAEAKPFDAKGDLAPLLVSWQMKSHPSSKTFTESLSASFYGGGASCSSGNLVKLWPQQQASFSVACDSLGDLQINIARVGALFKGTLDSMGSTANNATCSGWIVGGGCSCAIGPGEKLLASYPHVSNGWHCGCEKGPPIGSYAICASTSAELVKDGDCTAPKVLVGGGCNCGVNGIRKSAPSSKGWTCACDGSNDGSVGTRYSLCLAP